MAYEPGVTIEDSLRGIIRVAVLYCDNVSVGDGSQLWEEFTPFCGEIARRYQGQTISAVENIQTARELYRSIGVDPTRHRPSSEAMMRRLIKGKQLYRINSLVDTLNYCSLNFMLPLGLYDLEKVKGGNIIIRRGGPGDGYRGIGKDWVNVEGRFSLHDSEGPFGSPTADSARTCITDATTGAMIVIFAPLSLPEETLRGHSAFTARMMEKYGGGSPAVREAGLVE